MKYKVLGKWAIITIATIAIFAGITTCDGGGGDKSPTPAVNTDRDGDGMPNDWETQYGLNPDDPSDADLDKDTDLLTNLEEFTYSTDPTNPDTDVDGLNDYDEINYDGDSSKYTPGADTDPLNDDTDGDGSLDGNDMLPLEPCDFQDMDGDGYGPNCTLPSKNDCDDDPTDDLTQGYDPLLDSDGDGNYAEHIHPGLPEICSDNADNNCDGVTDFLGDNDLDGFDGCNDCDDNPLDNPVNCATLLTCASNQNPGALEQCPDIDNGGVDQDCNQSLICDLGTIDGDNDEYASLASGGTDCNDSNPNINPNAQELCPHLGGVGDENCDGSSICDGGTVDADGDEYASIASGGTDCDDDPITGPSVYPGAPELCDGIDNNCVNGILDEGVDNDSDGFSTCALPIPDCDDNNDAINPSVTEKCDNVDNNCTGGTDEGCDDDNDNYCDSSMVRTGIPSTCTAGGNDCRDDLPNINPGISETCNGTDDNCDGKTDYTSTIGDLDNSCGTDTFCKDFYCNEGTGCTSANINQSQTCNTTQYGSWGSCGSFSSTCDETGIQSRNITSYACNNGTCQSSITPETQSCTRNTNGTTCSATSYGAWSACGFSSTCDQTGTQSRTVTTYTCGGGVCQSSTTTETQNCTRNTNGVTCSPTSCGAYGSCGGFTSTCDQTGTKSRTCTQYTCGGGTCQSSNYTDTTSCTRNTDGISCGTCLVCGSGSCNPVPDPDSYEPNEDIPGILRGTVASSSTSYNYTYAYLYPYTDKDWFYYSVNDNEGIINNPQVQIQLANSGGGNLPADFDVCAYFRCFSSGNEYTPTCNNSAGNAINDSYYHPSYGKWLPGCCSMNTGTAIDDMWFEADCSLTSTDNVNVYIRVNGGGSSSDQSCSQQYRLRVRF